MSISTIRAGIKSKMQTVSGIASILDYVVWTDNWETIYQLFAGNTNRVNVWMVGLSSSPQVIISNGMRNRRYSFNLVGYYSIKTSNESSKAFEDIIGSIFNAFDSTTSIATGSDIVSHPTLVSINNSMFAQHPCHTAVISITIEDREEMTALCS